MSTHCLIPQQQQNNNVELHQIQTAVIKLKSYHMEKLGNEFLFDPLCSGAPTRSERSTWDRCRFHDPVMACGVIFR